jgi:hypothetical protein
MVNPFHNIYLAESGGSINDPHNVLGHGDSGSGIFYNGELIGNLWAIDLGGGIGHIALILPGINNNSTATTLVK